MIPWVREKFAERRARWIASRKRNENSTSSSSPSSTAVAAIATTSTSSVLTQPNTVNDVTGNGSTRGNFNPISTTTTRLINTPNSSRRIIFDQKHSKHQNNNSSGKLTGKFKSGNLNHQQDHQQDQQSISSQSGAVGGKQINVKIRSPNGREIVLTPYTTMKVSELKQEAIQKFAQDSKNALPLFATDIRQLYAKYRFIRPDSQLDIQEQLTIDAAGIQNNETLNLCIRRTNHQLDLMNLRAPTITDIALATLNQQQSENRPRRAEVNEILLQADLQFDVRKVIISLAESSAYIIGSGPYAQRLISMFRQRLANKRKHQIDTLQCLVDMGFSQEKASYALRIQNGIYSAALDWLIEHQNDEIPVDDTIPTLLSPTASKVQDTNDSVANIQALLDIIRIYSQRDIPPPAEAVSALIDMGFEQKDVLKALRLTRNNQSAACEWLCGNRSTSLTELRDGLSPESPILKAMMDSPQVQMSLSNPKMFIAYLSMLENHNALSMWLGDSDTSSVLSHILRKYHEEKHILGINQFNANNNNNNSSNSNQ